MKRNSKINVSEPTKVTFALAAYNQEAYVVESVASALSQTYTPLEVILSDDASSDATYEIMSRCVRDYHGPHRVILNRNPSNLGLVAHCNKLLAMAAGEILVTAGGDDISLPDRTTEIVAKFKSDSRIRSVISDVLLFGDKTGYLPRRNLGRMAPLLETVLLRQFPAGMSAAYDVVTLRKFPVLDASQKAEDIPWSFRCALFGINAYIPKALVRYRVHNRSVMHSINDPQHSIRMAELYSGAWLQKHKDFAYYCSYYNKLAIIYRPFLSVRVFSESRCIERAKNRRSPTVLEMLIASVLKCSRILRLVHYRDWRSRKCAALSSKLI
jgi:glycosyltransferase involved in cell wall biosynthesis